LPVRVISRIACASRVIGSETMFCRIEDRTSATSPAIRKIRLSSPTSAQKASLICRRSASMRIVPMRSPSSSIGPDTTMTSSRSRSPELLQAGAVQTAGAVGGVVPGAA